MHTLDDPQTVRRLSLPDQARSLATILREEFGVPFRFFGANDGADLPADDRPSRGAEPSREEPAWVVRFGAVEQSGVIPGPGRGLPPRPLAPRGRPAGAGRRRR